jgi:very-short-patch-repair endonuclease
MHRATLFRAAMFIVSLPLVGGGIKGGGMGVERARQLRKTMSLPEARLWAALRELRRLGHHFRRQVPLGPYYADFCCHKARLVIEVDGDTHYVGTAPEHDRRRDAFIRAEGYQILHVPNSDVMGNLEGVVAAVLAELEQE